MARALAEVTRSAAPAKPVRLEQAKVTLALNITSPRQDTSRISDGFAAGMPME